MLQTCLTINNNLFFYVALIKEALYKEIILKNTWKVNNGKLKIEIVISTSSHGTYANLYGNILHHISKS